MREIGDMVYNIIIVYTMSYSWSFSNAPWKTKNSKSAPFYSKRWCFQNLWNQFLFGPLGSRGVWIYLEVRFSWDVVFQQATRYVFKNDLQTKEWMSSVFFLG